MKAEALADYVVAIDFDARMDMFLPCGHRG